MSVKSPEGLFQVDKFIICSLSSGWPLVGNEGPSTFTAWYIGDETSLIPYESGQLVISW